MLNPGPPILSKAPEVQAQENARRPRGINWNHRWSVRDKCNCSRWVETILQQNLKMCRLVWQTSAPGHGWSHCRDVCREDTKQQWTQTSYYLPCAELSVQNRSLWCLYSYKCKYFLLLSKGSVALFFCTSFGTVLLGLLWNCMHHSVFNHSTENPFDLVSPHMPYHLYTSPAASRWICRLAQPNSLP